MKRICLMVLSMIIMQSVSAQNNNLVIYSQEGLAFTVILNGIRQNAEPQTNVKITGLNAPNYQVKLIFANNMPDLDQQVMMVNAGENASNTEISYAVQKVKERYKLRWKSAAPIAGIPADPQQTVIVYTPTNAVVAGNTTVTTTTSTVGSGTAGGASVGMSVNGGGMGMGMNVNVSATDMSMGSNVTNTSTTTTYSTTTTASGSDLGMNSGSTYVLQGYTGVYGCPYPMSPSDFESAKKSIASKGFDESRLTIAKQIIGSNCLLCSQIKELMELMSFEATRLDLAKFAWHHNLDKGNYFKLNDAFTFESSIDELNAYTSSH